MPVWLDTRDSDFEARFVAFLGAKREAAEEVDADVAKILTDVRVRGDAALFELTKRFDRFDPDEVGLRVSADDLDAAVRASPPAALDALRLAQRRVAAYHERQRPSDVSFTDELGVELGWRWRAIESVGLYVPGGLASYPSSVVMNATPAKVAGCGRIAMAVPAPQGEINPLVLAAARIAGVDEIYRVGGAQAIAALAYGTRTIRPVMKIFGPGNAYVAAAKRRVFGHVGIDLIAGPSEVVVIADGDAKASWIAADLLAQAEHDEAAQAILVTNSPPLAQAVAIEVDAQAASLPKAKIAQASWRDYGALILVPSLAEGARVADRIAPEHLEIHARDPDAVGREIKNAGAIFLGERTPEAIGDYVGGSNHVLPTSRSARFSSGLGVYDFVKRTSLLKCDANSLAALAGAAATLGEAEGLEAHARSVRMREL